LFDVFKSVNRKCVSWRHLLLGQATVRHDATIRPVSGVAARVVPDTRSNAPQGDFIVTNEPLEGAVVNVGEPLKAVRNFGI
jgi:hypothetical protein